MSKWWVLVENGGVISLQIVSGNKEFSESLH